MIPRILAIAGSDSGGGAGIQADLKTAMALGAYASTAITALTAQDTTGVHGVHPVPPDFIRQQIAVALADPGADAIKTGMLGTAAVIEAVADALAKVERPLVVDPVMVAKGGARLLNTDAISALKAWLLPLATLVTPNLPEAEVLCGMSIADDAAMRLAASMLLTLGPQAVLLKGGHGMGETVLDLLVTADGIREFRHPRQQTRHSHGTGCTLASAVACGLAAGLALERAVEQALDYVQAAISAAPGIGRGHGPLGHHAPWSVSNSGADLPELAPDR